MPILTLLNRYYFPKLDIINYEKLNRYEDPLYKALDCVFKKVSKRGIKIIILNQLKGGTLRLIDKKEGRI